MDMNVILRPSAHRLLRSLPTDPKESAKEIGLRYVHDSLPGIRRVKQGKGFAYLSSKGKRVCDASLLKRIHSLVLPPAWKNVWICPLANGHLQATGYDERGRKQYRYHPRFRAVRDETKYHRMVPFALALPLIRARVEKDLHAPALSRLQVLAAVVRLLEETLIRVGNEEYAEENHSYGLTTLHDAHVKVHGSALHFSFLGKSGKRHILSLKDGSLSRIVAKCQDLPGHELFQYKDDQGHVQDVSSQDVNEYLQEITGEDFTAKDFRTWAGTVQAALLLQDTGEASSKTQCRHNIVRAIEAVSEKLGNTPAICRKCYVHPIILASYADHSLLPRLMCLCTSKHCRNARGFSLGEAAVLAFLQECF